MGSKTMTARAAAYALRTHECQCASHNCEIVVICDDMGACSRASSLHVCGTCMRGDHRRHRDCPSCRCGA